MADWYVYQRDGEPLGPWSTAVVAEAILVGTLAPDIWVAAPGGPRWLRALDVPVIGRLIDGIPTRPGRRESGLLRMPPVRSMGGRPTALASTLTIARVDELAGTEEAPVSEKEPPTTRIVPAGAGDTAQMPAMSFDTDQVPAIARDGGTDFFGAWKAGYDRALAIADASTGPHDDRSTDPAFPPSSTTPSPPPGARHDVSECPSTDRRRRTGA